MTPSRPLPSTRGHLDALTATGADGHLVVSTPMPERERVPWASWSFPVDEVDQAAQAAADLDAQGRNVYIRTNLIAYPLTDSGPGWSWARGGGADTGAAVALVVDLDVVGPSHKPGATKLPLPPDMATAMTIVAELPAPSMTIGTGDGNAHAWWLLDEAETDDPVGLTEAWADGIVEAGARRGFHVDRPDAARVLRPCGTHRRKRGLRPNRVELVGVAGWPEHGLAVRPWCPTGRYGARELLEALPPPPPPAPPPAPSRPRRESRPGEVTPADAVSMLTWSEILEPYGFTFAGMGRMGDTACELWLRPGDPTSDYSIKAIPGGPCVVWSGAAGLPTGKGQKLSKFRTWCHLAGLTESDAARMVGRRHREVNRGL